MHKRENAYHGFTIGREKSFGIHTSIAFSLVAGVGMMIVGITAAPWALRAMSTPEDILGPSTTYRKVLQVLYLLLLMRFVIYTMMVS